MAEHPELPLPFALRLRLDEQALTDNWRTLDRLSGRAKAGAAVKADGYGMGARRVTRVLCEAGCADFFVAHCGEAAELAGLVEPRRIAVLHGPVTAEEAAFCRETGITPVLNSPTQLARWREAGGKSAHVMIDSGINRLGFDRTLDPALFAGLEVDILLSHLASADEDGPQNTAQRIAFEQARSAVPHRRASLANSAGIALGESFHFDLTRPGLALYGGVPRGELAGVIRQVAFPEVQVLQVRRLAAGDKVGYNATFTASQETTVAVVSLGYADGFLRCWSGGKGGLTFGGKVLPVLGRVSMDMTVVDISSAPDVREGDWLDVAYDLPMAAERSGLTQYELLTVLGRRFVRD